jgi:hypothetical protein
MRLYRLHGMRRIVTLLFTLYCSNAFAQTRLPSYFETTTQVISEISGDWQKDSLGTNSYRLQVYHRLKDSKVDTMSKAGLFKALGKPNYISKFYSGITNKHYVGYRYYVFCLNDYHKEPCMGSYIEFIFDESETNFISIDEGDICG